MTALTFDRLSSNDAVLLLAFHDIISNVAMEDTIVVIDTIAWLIDEIGSRAATMVKFLELERQEVPWQLRGLAEMYGHLPRAGRMHRFGDPHG